MAEKNTARAFWVQEPGTGALRPEALPEPRDGDVVVRTLYSGISRGTEGRVFRGEVPASVAETMRCPHQKGDFPGPVKYGYISVGRVEEGRGPEAEALEGRAVFCLHPHQDRYVVPASDVVPIPTGVPAERAVLVANMETALNGVWDAGVGVGDRVAVVGAGVVGSLVAWLCASLPGSRVIAVDPEPSRRSIAEALGFEWLPAPPDAYDADVVIHASGTESGLRDALALAGPEARVVELSWFGDRDVALPLGGSFHPRRLTLRSSQVGNLPPDRVARWTHRRRLEVALKLLRDPALDVLISDEVRFADLPDALRDLSVGRDPALCVRVVYEPASTNT